VCVIYEESLTSVEKDRAYNARKSPEVIGDVITPESVTGLSLFWI
jgi:hypothetical protein